MKFVRPGLVDEVEDCSVGVVLGCGKNACGFVQEDDSADVCLEDFASGDELVEFPDGKSAVGGRFAVEDNFSIAQERLRMAFPEACAFGDELDDVHGCVRKS